MWSREYLQSLWSAKLYTFCLRTFLTSYFHIINDLAFLQDYSTDDGPAMNKHVWA